MRRNIGYMCRLGSSAFLCEVAIACMMFVGNIVFIHYLQEEGVAAFSIACYFFPIIFMVYNAIAPVSYTHLIISTFPRFIRNSIYHLLCRQIYLWRLSDNKDPCSLLDVLGIYLSTIAAFIPPLLLAYTAMVALSKKTGTNPAITSTGPSLVSIMNIFATVL